MYLMVQPLSGGGARPGSCPVAITWREVSCRVAKPLAMRAGCWPAGRVSSTGSVGVVDRTFCLCRGGFELDDGGREFGRPVLFQATVLVLLTAAARAGIVAAGSWHSASLLSRLGREGD